MNNGTLLSIAVESLQEGRGGALQGGEGQWPGSGFIGRADRRATYGEQARSSADMAPPLRAAAAHGVTYRPMTDDDLPFVAELYASTRRAEIAATGWPSEMQEAFLRQQHEAQHSHYSRHFGDGEWLIVERAGTALGRLYLHDQPGRLHILDISLVPESRGMGIGGAILRDVLDQARTQGKGASIHVEKMNRARHLYERLGFKVAEDLGIYDLLHAD